MARPDDQRVRAARRLRRRQHRARSCLTQTESELASVLGHEITHVTQHHIARSIGNQRDAMLSSLAALARRILASRSHSSSSGDIARPQSPRRRAWPSRARSTTRARTNRRPTGSASRALTRRASIRARWQRSSSACSGRRAWFEGNSPSYFHDHPETYQRICRSAGTRLHQAVPPGARLARLPDGARAAQELRGDAQGRRPVLP